MNLINCSCLFTHNFSSHRFKSDKKFNITVRNSISADDVICYEIPKNELTVLNPVNSAKFSWIALPSSRSFSSITVMGCFTFANT